MSTISTPAPAVRQRRPRWTNRRIHKWIAVPLGAVLLVWTLSGVVMILPHPTPDLAPPAGPPDFTRARISPAAAIEAVAATGADVSRVRSVSLHRIRDAIVYRIQTSGGSHLIDAATGEPFTIDAALAEQIARERLPGAHPVKRVEHVTEYDAAYFFGPLPTYRVVFDDGRGTYLYVSPLDGSVQPSNRFTRLRTMVTSLHDFSPVARLLGHRIYATGLLLLASAITLALIWTGYVLAVPRSWRGRGREGRS